MLGRVLLLSLALMAASGLATAADPKALPDDPATIAAKLAEPIDLNKSIEGAPLSDVLDLISKQTGVSFRNTLPIQYDGGKNVLDKSVVVKVTTPRRVRAD